MLRESERLEAEAGDKEPEKRGKAGKGPEGDTERSTWEERGERLGGAVPAPWGPSPRQDMPHKRCRKEETLMVKTRHRHRVVGCHTGM